MISNGIFRNSAHRSTALVPTTRCEPCPILAALRFVAAHLVQ